ncbi:MAG: tetratricopeptide repeat protein, partial [Candidatus Poribacteria bacterium]
MIKYLLKFTLLLIVIFALSGCAIFGIGEKKPTLKYNAEFYIQEGDNYLNAQDYDMAIKSYSNALKKDAKSIETRRKLAEIYIKVGNTDLALQEFDNILKINPKYILAHNYKGFIYSDQGKWGLAIKEFESALKIDPNNLYALGHLGLAYRMSGRTEDAKNILLKAIELDPEMDDPESRNIHNYLGLVYKDEGLYDKAIAEYQKTLEHFPDDTKARNYIGEIYEIQNRYYEAIAEYNKTLKISPQDSYAKSRLEELQKAGINTFYVDSIEIVKDDPEYYIGNAPDARQYPDAGAIMLLNKISYEVTDKGRLRYTIHWIVKIFNDRGIAEFGEIAVPFNSVYQNIGVNIARTILPNGTEVNAADDAYHDITLPGVADYNMYSDIMLKVVNMPALMPGAIIEFKATVEDAEDSDGKSWIWGGMDFQGSEPIQNAKCVLRIPKEKKINWKLSNCQIDPIITEEEKTMTYIWIARDIPAVYVEDAMPPLEEIIPNLFFTSDESWDSVYKWYKDLADPKEKLDDLSLFDISFDFQPDLDSGEISETLIKTFSDKGINLSQKAILSKDIDDDSWRIVDGKNIYTIKKKESAMTVYDEIIEKKTLELVADKESKEEKIRAIYEYVAGQIRYVAIELGLGAYEPTSAIDVFTYKYGDCKDKTTLLIAMLRHIGVPAYQVLVSPAPSKSINLAIPSIAQFSHVITAIPMDNGDYLWLDPTVATCRFGDLPAGDQGRKVFVIGKDRGEFVDTPIFPPESNKIYSDGEITIAEDGTITGWEKTMAKGQADMFLKSLYRLMKHSEQRKLAESIINQRYPGAIVNEFAISDVTDLNIPMEIKVGFSCPKYLSDLNGMIILPLPSEDFSSYAGLVGGNDERKYDFHLGYNMAVQKELRVSIPDNYEIGSLPEDISINYEFGSFIRKYEKINDKSI